MKKLNFIFFLVCNIAFSQHILTEKQIDSIQKTIYTTTPENADIIETTCTELYYKSKDIGYRKGQMEALLRLSAFRINSKKNLEKASEDLSEVSKLAMEEDNYYYYCKAKGTQAAIFNSLNLYDKAKNILDENFRLIPKIKENNKRTLTEAFYYGRYINLYGYQNMQDSVQHYADKRLQAALRLPDNEPEKPLLITSTARLLCTLYADKKDFGKMEYYLKMQEKYIKNIDNLFDLAFYHKTKGEFIFNTKHRDKLKDRHYLDSVLYHFKRAEKYAVQAKNPTVAQTLYEEIANVYKLKDSIEKQAKYLNDFTVLKDSVRKIEDRYINNTLKLAPKEQKPKKEVYSARSGNNMIYYSLAILLILFLCYYLLKYKIFSRRIKKEISVLTESRGQNVSFGELMEMALHNCNSFYINFQRMYPGFGTSLLAIDPSLKPSDIEFCALLKLNLDTRQIAESKKITVRAVEAKKYRIRKRLEIPSEQNINVWISRL